MWLLGGRSYSIAKWWYQVKERDRELRKEIESRGERERERVRRQGRGEETTRRKAHRPPWRGDGAQQREGSRKEGEGREKERGRTRLTTYQGPNGPFKWAFLEFQNLPPSF